MSLSDINATISEEVIAQSYQIYRTNTNNVSTISVLLFSIVWLSSYIIIRAVTKPKCCGRSLPPSLPSIPLLGSFPFMSGVYELPEFFRKTSQRLGPVFGVTVGNEYTIVLNTREVINEALLKKAAAFSGRLPGYTTVHYLNPQRYGIVGKQYGAAFRRMHRLTLAILKEFGFGSRLMQERILEEIEELLEIIEEHRNTPFNPGDVFSRCTINVIASIVFGKRISQLDAKLEMLAQNFRGFIQGKRRHIDHCPALRYLPQFKTALLESMQNQKEIMDFIEEYSAVSLRSDRQSFVKSFVEREGPSYYRQELNFLIRDLLIAGSETTSATVQFAMIRMANLQGMQKIMQAEINSIVGDKNYVTLDDLPRLPYSEAFILEVMRLHPAVPLAIPHYTLCDTELAGYFVPKGTTVFPNIRSAHMDPGVWKDPDEFRPDRFISDDGVIRGRDLVIPFSIGKRSCLGELLARQEIFLIITNLVHKFNILPPEGHDSVTISENFLITLFPSPFELRFVPRS